MKKTYFTPEVLTVSLAMSSPLATSGFNVTNDGDQATLPSGDDDDDYADDGAPALVKGYTSQNLWNNEW